MLQTVSRCRPVSLRAWVCLMGLGIVTWTLPTLSVSSVHAQSKSQPTGTIQPISKSQVKLIGILESLEDEIVQPVPAGKPRVRSINELPEFTAQKNSNKQTAGFVDPLIKLTSGFSFDFVKLMNSYFEAVKTLRNSGVTLKQKQRHFKKGYVSQSELQALQADIEAARRKTELIRKMTQATLQSAEEELKILSEERKRVELIFNRGDQLLAVKLRETKVRSNLKILKLLIESMNATEPKTLQAVPDKSTEPQTNSSTTNSNSEIAKTIQVRLGLHLSEAGVPSTLLQSKYHGGLRVLKVMNEGPADKSGIREGDFLVGLDRWETISLENVNFVLSKPDKFQDNRLKFYVVRDGNTLFGHMQIAQ